MHVAQRYPKPAAVAAAAVAVATAVAALLRQTEKDVYYYVMYVCYVIYSVDAMPIMCIFNPLLCGK